ncbi:MAG: hypothetical protein Fur007_15540 [Rhodoferax sp.]
MDILPIVWQLVADRQGLPVGAVLCAPTPALIPALQACSAHPQWPALCSGLTLGVVDAQASPDTEAAMRDAGVAAWPAAALTRHDAAWPAAQPIPTPWLTGRWWEHPVGTVTGAQASRAVTLKLVQLIAADADTRDIEDALRQEPTLAYQLLRLVNSAGFGARQPITSFGQAVLMLGRSALARWLNLMLFAPRAKGELRAAMLQAQVALRARTLELLAKAMGMDRALQDAAFMTGLLSLLGALLGQALPPLIEPLPLDKLIKSALLAQQGELAALLALAQHAQAGDGPALQAALQALGLDADLWLDAHLHALSWTVSLTAHPPGDRV